MQTFGAFDGAAFDAKESREVIFIARWIAAACVTTAR